MREGDRPNFCLIVLGRVADLRLAQRAISICDGILILVTAIVSQNNTMVILVTARDFNDAS